MTPALWIMALALLWVGVTGRATFTNLLIGSALGYIVLAFAGRVPGVGRTFRHLTATVDLLAYFAKELVLANLRVAHDVVTPTYYMRPAIIGIQLDARTDGEITLLAALVTLTPGTLCLSVSSDRRMMYVHAMFVDDRDRLERSIKHGLERRMLRVLR